MEDVLICLQIMLKVNPLKPPIRNLHKYKNTTTLKLQNKNINYVIRKQI